jgi:hypothetical protein
MKIYLHCGYHKTGSSFIQMMLSTNRSFLKENGYHYPISKDDQAAKQGQISPGNGLKLSQAIHHKEDAFLQAKNILQNWIDEAKKNNCDKLIISSEGLFHSLASIDFQLFFQQMITEFKLDGIALLLFLRDSLDHIFSLYKHRGKRGTIQNFKDWVENNYETLQLTEQFFDKMIPDSNVELSLRKYKNDSQHLSEAVFKDWLQIPTPSIPKSDRVNTSLSLSEIMVLENVYQLLGPEKTLKIQKGFMKNSNPKPKEDKLKTYYAYQIDVFLNKHLPLIEKINLTMPENEHLIIESLNNQPFIADLQFAALSSEQLKLIIMESSLKIGLKDKILKRMKVVYNKLRK